MVSIHTWNSSLRVSSTFIHLSLEFRILFALKEFIMLSALANVFDSCKKCKAKLKMRFVRAVRQWRNKKLDSLMQILSRVVKGLRILMWMQWYPIRSLKYFRKAPILIKLCLHNLSKEIMNINELGKYVCLKQKRRKKDRYKLIAMYFQE